MIATPPVQELPARHERMADLDWFLGLWSVHSRTRDAENPELWHEETLFAEHTAELNGNLIWEHFFGPVQGQPYEAWSLRKYDASRDRWLQKWADSAPGGMILNWSGTWDEAARTYIGYGEAHLNPDYTLKVYPRVGHSLSPSPTMADDHLSLLSEQPKADLAAWVLAHGSAAPASLPRTSEGGTDTFWFLPAALGLAALGLLARRAVVSTESHRG